MAEKKAPTRYPYAVWAEVRRLPGDGLPGDVGYRTMIELGTTDAPNVDAAIEQVVYAEGMPEGTGGRVIAMATSYLHERTVAITQKPVINIAPVEPAVAPEVELKTGGKS